MSLLWEEVGTIYLQFTEKYLERTLSQSRQQHLAQATKVLLKVLSCL